LILRSVKGNPRSAIPGTPGVLAFLTSFYGNGGKKFTRKAAQLQRAILLSILFLQSEKARQPYNFLSASLK
jgi:hypothetical protein